MRLAALAPLSLLLSAFACFGQAAQPRQNDAALRINAVAPYPRVAPGQIIELRVEGFDERFISPPPGDVLSILLTQDGATTEARVRTTAPTLVREAPATPDGPVGMKQLQSMTFVVPRSLRAGEAEVAVSYRGRRSAPFKLEVVERPQRPAVGSAPVMTIAA